MVTVGAVVLFLIALLVLHPFLLAIPSRIGEWRFERAVYIGMQESAVIALARDTGANQDSLYIKGNEIVLWYPHAETICASVGNEYILHFGRLGNLLGYTEQQYSSYC